MQQKKSKELQALFNKAYKEGKTGVNGLQKINMLYAAYISVPIKLRKQQNYTFERLCREYIDSITRIEYKPLIIE